MQSWYQCQWCHMTKTSHCMSFWLSWHNKCSGATDNAIGITWCQYWCQWCHITKKLNFAPFFNHLDWENVVMPFTMSVVSPDTDTSANGATWPKIHIASHFNQLDQINAMVSLAVPLASHDTDAVPMASHGQRNNVEPHFNYLDLMNAIVPLTTQKHHMTPVLVQMVSHDQKSCCISFWLSWPNECNGTITMPSAFCENDAGINGGHKTKNVMLHFFPIVLT